ncbi:MAG: holo-ACP synthase [Armatimonadetes bacterium]|nr:holo-ACP synthase [Armatimonadota bacterium]
MIIAVGIDIVEIARIEKAIRKQEFAEKLFSPDELRDANEAAHVAGRWAAKEAIAKALPMAIAWREVEILNHESGAPYARFSEKVDMKKGWRVHISITHEKGYAAAVAVLEDSQ